MSIRRVTDPAELAALFGRHRETHVYGLADLEEPYWSRSRWWRRGDAVVGVIDLPGDEGEVAFYAISADHPDATLDLFLDVLDEIPAGAVGTGPIGLHMLVDVLRDCDDHGVRHKLVVTPEALVVPPLLRAVELVEVGPDDHEDLVALHATDPGAVFFLPSMYAGGMHLGARHDGRLVAAAGTHVRSATHRVAAIGAVLTDPAYRGLGLAGALVGELSRRLLATGDTVGLNVRDDNPVARRVYDRLGFQPVQRYEEVALR